MPFWFSFLQSTPPSLPDHCEPTTAFLTHLSSAFGTCVPTNQALISTILGTCSIVAWLFAQLPQIYKNYKLHSTAGLSIFFLGEWFLGDSTNLLGSIFTKQATWQVIIASYYCAVDCVLLGQWLWYEHLKHGRPLRAALARRNEEYYGYDGAADVNTRNMREVMEGKKTSKQAGAPQTRLASKPLDTPSPREHRFFRMPNFAYSPSSASSSKADDDSTLNGTPTGRTIHRLASSSSPYPSPKTVLYISLILGVLAQASPVQSSPPPHSVYHSFAAHLLEKATSNPASRDTPTPTQAAGTILSWLSTFLYLGSRLPQLIKNHSRRSTSGLSPTLFLAAFFGNLFYSSSLLTNPCAWNTYEPYSSDSRGWVAYEEGSVKREWVLRALPFFLGAAGVLVMDALVGLQFVYFGDGLTQTSATKGAEEAEPVIVVSRADSGDDLARRPRMKWRRVSGWMRGWVPSVSVAGTPRALSPAPRAGGEREGLLRRDSPSRDGGRRYGGV